MSGNVVPTKVALVEDPQLAFRGEREYAVLRGGSTVAWQSFPANSVANGNIQITCNPPSRQHVISRRVFLTVNMTINFSGTGNPLLQLGTNDGLRAYPLSSIIGTQSMTIGDNSVSLTSFSQFWPYLLRYHNEVLCQDRENSMAPSMLDSMQNYDDWTSLGSARNPLAFFGENSAQTPRGAFPYNSVTNGNGTASINVTITEPIFMSPFLFARGDNETGLTGIDSMSYTATLGNLERVWSHSSTGNTLSSATVTINQASLQFQYITAPETQSIPRQIVYPYSNIVSYSTAYSSVVAAGDGPVQIASQSIQLSGIPRRMYIFARERDQDLTFTSTDTFFWMNTCVVTFDTSNYLSAAQPTDLYRMAVKNGVGMSWPQWSQYTGSILCVDFGTDIGLKSLEAPGCIGTHQLQVTGTFTNVNSTQGIQPSLFLVIVYEGTISVVDGSVLRQENPLTNRDVLDAQPAFGVTYKRVESIYGGGALGGDFFSSIKSFGRKLANVVREVYPYAKAAAPYILPLASKFLGGRGERRMRMRQPMRMDPRQMRTRMRMVGSGLGERIGKLTSGRASRRDDFGQAQQYYSSKARQMFIPEDDEGYGGRGEDGGDSACEQSEAEEVERRGDEYYEEDLADGVDGGQGGEADDYEEGGEVVDESADDGEDMYQRKSASSRYGTEGSFGSSERGFRGGSAKKLYSSKKSEKEAVEQWITQQRAKALTSARKRR